MSYRINTKNQTVCINICAILLGNMDNRFIRGLAIPSLSSDNFPAAAISISIHRIFLLVRGSAGSVRVAHLLL